MANNNSVVIDTLIIGSGLAGLSAANELSNRGFNVVIVDKGRGVGGRLAVRRIGEAIFDNGAQFFTARSERFKTCVNEWIISGVVEQWYQSYPGQPKGHPRYRGTPNMASIAEHLAKNQSLMQSIRVESLNYDDHHWAVKLDNTDTVIARSIVITCPVPQVLELLNKDNIVLLSEFTQRLEKIEYESCISVMAVLDGPTIVEDPGALVVDQGPIAWISDNHKKGVSPIPAITIHANGDFSAKHFNRDRLAVGKELIEQARALFGTAKVLNFQVHGWLYSKPIITDNDASLLVSNGSEMPPLVIAGDAFAGPRFEGAVHSGWSAAKQIEGALQLKAVLQL
jgi:renalase